ncbi:MAG: FecCD family ABC transporter permease [Nitrospirales bacterium]
MRNVEEPQVAGPGKGAPPLLALPAGADRSGGDALPVLMPGRWMRTLFGLAGLSLLVVVACLRLGFEEIGWGDMLRIFGQALRGGEWTSQAEQTAGVILLQVRLPRVLLGFLVGGTLAGVGVGLQALLRNPLADPYIMGISSGAALGAGIAILLGIGTTVMAISALPLCAFLGGLVSLAIVYRIAASYGRLPVHTLLLAGVILNAMFSALIMFIASILDPNRAFGMMYWLMGTLSAPNYTTLVVLLCYLAAGGVVLLGQVRALNLLSLGEDAARSLGVEVETSKKLVFITAALLTGAVVSVSGLIGFVGLVVPHAVRLVLGPDHRLLLPAAAMVGGMFLVLADAVARTVFAPAEIPVGVVTALAGGPVFIYLLMNRKGGLA